MKYPIYVFAVVLFFMTALHAAEPTDIDREIAKIRSAPPQERVKLMNDFKRRLFQMNQNQRRMAIERLRNSMHDGGGRVPNRGTMPQRMMNPDRPPAGSGIRQPQHPGGSMAAHPPQNQGGFAAPSFEGGMRQGNRDGPKQGKGPMGNGRH